VIGVEVDQCLLIMKTLERRYRHSKRAPRSEPVLKQVRISRCSAYDCEYAALAYDLNIPLITEDRGLLEAFPDIACDMRALAISSPRCRQTRAD
jgi:predicted nucleic acid-binding protein